MKFPDHSDLGIVTVEDVGDFRVSMDRVGTAAPPSDPAAPLDVERLAAALDLHANDFPARNHTCDGRCTSAIAREYAALRAAIATPAPKEADRG